MKRLARIIYSWIRASWAPLILRSAENQTKDQSSHISSGKLGRVKSPDEPRQLGHGEEQTAAAKTPLPVCGGSKTPQPRLQNSWCGAGKGAAGQGKMPVEEVCLQPQPSWEIRCSSCWLPVAPWQSLCLGRCLRHPRPNHSPHLCITELLVRGLTFEARDVSYPWAKSYFRVLRWLYAASQMTALVSTLAGQCSHADDHSLAQHTINFPQLSLMATEALGTPSPCRQMPPEKRGQM